jgi:drug/metabolite transporter (DMT)-like permease
MVVLMTPITFLPAVFVWETPSNFSEIFILILIAIIATLGNFFWTRAISLSKLTNLMPFDFSKLIFATFLGFIFFNEQIDSITIICGIGIVFCNSMLFKRLNFEKK